MKCELWRMSILQMTIFLSNIFEFFRSEYIFKLDSLLILISILPLIIFLSSIFEFFRSEYIFNLDWLLILVEKTFWNLFFGRDADVVIASNYWKQCFEDVRITQCSCVNRVNVGEIQLKLKFTYSRTSFIRKYDNPNRWFGSLSISMWSGLNPLNYRVDIFESF